MLMVFSRAGKIGSDWVDADINHESKSCREGTPSMNMIFGEYCYMSLWEYRWRRQ